MQGLISVLWQFTSILWQFLCHIICSWSTRTGKICLELARWKHPGSTSLIYISLWEKKNQTQQSRHSFAWAGRQKIIHHNNIQTWTTETSTNMSNFLTFHPEPKSDCVSLEITQRKGRQKTTINVCESSRNGQEPFAFLWSIGYTMGMEQRVMELISFCGMNTILGRIHERDGWNSALSHLLLLDLVHCQAYECQQKMEFDGLGEVHEWKSRQRGEKMGWERAAGVMYHWVKI